uniref:MAPK regulated corepressor interacting protein 2 n=1 Tax=Chrysolophus pictus TaxID=9089 RepID=A0A8C3LR97_CHRPC
PYTRVLFHADGFTSSRCTLPCVLFGQQLSWRGVWDEAAPELLPCRAVLCCCPRIAFVLPHSSGTACAPGPCPTPVPQFPLCWAELCTCSTLVLSCAEQQQLWGSHVAAVTAAVSPAGQPAGHVGRALCILISFFLRYFWAVFLLPPSRAELESGKYVLTVGAGDCPVWWPPWGQPGGQLCPLVHPSPLLEWGGYDGAAPGWWHRRAAWHTQGGGDALLLVCPQVVLLPSIPTFPSPAQKLIFNRVNGKRPQVLLSQTSVPEESYTAAHEENVRFIYEAWQEVEQQLDGGQRGESARGPVQYVEKTPNPKLEDFVPIDLEEWWAQQFLAKV